MGDPDFLTTDDGRRIAYHKPAARRFFFKKSAKFLILLIFVSITPGMVHRQGHSRRAASAIGQKMPVTPSRR